MILNETGKSSWGWWQNVLISVDQNTGKVTYNGEYYVFKHFSHFVRPGAKRIMATGPWGNKIAFVNGDGSIVLVLGNTSDKDQEVKITVDDQSKTTLAVSLSAHSINTFVIAAEN